MIAGKGPPCDRFRQEKINRPVAHHILARCFFDNGLLSARFLNEAGIETERAQGMAGGNNAAGGRDKTLDKVSAA